MARVPSANMAGDMQVWRPTGPRHRESAVIVVKVGGTWRELSGMLARVGDHHRLHVQCCRAYR